MLFSQTLNSTIEFNDLKNISAKVALDKKFAQFSVDKLELKSGSSALETSLSNVLPGLKLEFKGDDNKKAELAATFKHDFATLTSEVDIANFQSLKASACSARDGFAIGASGHFERADGKLIVKDLGLGLSISKIPGVFLGLKSTKKFSDHLLHFTYALNKEVGLVGSVAYPSKVVNLGAKYSCNPKTSLKVKLDTDQKIGFSSKHKLDSSSTITGAITLDLKNLQNYKYGVIASLG
jgi:hypothetical protein